MAMKKAYLTYEEAAQYIGIKRASIYNYIHDLKITTHKFKRNRRRYIAIEDVERMKTYKEMPWKVDLGNDREASQNDNKQ